MTTPSQRIRLIALAAVACLLLAGCTSQEPADPKAGGVGAGKTEQTILDKPDEVAGSSQTTGGGKAEAAPGNGEIRGTVHDDAGLPVAEALVGLLGTERSAVTNSTGGFRFANISAGAHTVRISPDPIFRVHEGKVTVVANRVTLVTITLVPVDGRGPGYRPHLHDYWGANSELLLMDAALDWSRSPGCGTSYQAYGAAGQILTGVYAPNNAAWWLCFGIPDLDTGQPPIVLPGTAGLRFSVTWGNDVDVDKFVFGYHAADAKPGAYEKLGAVGKGEELTVPIAPESSDNGHQMFSLWQFRIQPAPRSTPMTILGPLNVKIFMIKGDLPVDPPHEDFWGGNTTYLSRSFATPHGGTTICCTDFHIRLGMDSGRLVPPGTKELNVRFGYALTRSPGTPADFEWDLLVKPANLPPGAPMSEYKLMTPAAKSTGVKEYVLPVTPGETDAFYQKQSNWMFAIRQSPDAPEGSGEFEHHFNLEVISNKDPGFA